MLLVDRQALSEHTTTSSSTKSLGQALRVSLVKPGAYLSESQIRIFIEHAIGGMKRYSILVHVFRNRKADFEDDAVGICAGLWNFALSY